MSSAAEALLAQLGIAPDVLARRGLRAYGEASELELAETGADGREHFLVRAAAQAWRSMKSDAREDGIDLYVVSAFRSIERQAAIVQRKLDAGQAIDDILTVCAAPGYSEHHTGCAIDVSTPGSRALETEFDQTPAFAWLMHNAGRHGFVLSYPRGNRWGYQYEPWHWCYRDASAIA